jgi:methyltransferase OMS1, mitochondrial
MQFFRKVIASFALITAIEEFVSNVDALSIPRRESSLHESKELLHPRPPVVDVYCQRFDDQNLKRRDIFHRLKCYFIAGCSIVKTPSLFTTSSCYALTPNEAQQQYDTYATSYDQIDGGQISTLLGIDNARKLLIEQAYGKVLEVGVGTGLNLRFYKNDQITSLDLVDISPGMLQEARNKVLMFPNLQNIPINFVTADMTSQLVDHFGSESFDTVIDTFSMCVLGSKGTQQCLDQLCRLIRTDGGQLLLLENSRSSNPLLGFYQDTTADIVATAGGRGCLYNQDIDTLIRSNHQLRIVDEHEFATGLFRSFRCTRNF